MGPIIVRILQAFFVATVLFLAIGLMLDVPDPSGSVVVLGITIPALALYVLFGKIERWMRR